MAQPTDDEEITKKYGKPLKYDAQFKGPLKNRSCTDIICLLLFIVFLVAWALCAVYAFRYGEPNRFISSVDSLNRKCGIDSAVINKPYLFFFDLTKCASPNVLLNGCPTPQVCLESCPSESWSSLPYRTRLKTFDAKDIQDHIICQDEKTKLSIDSVQYLDHVVRQGLCTDWYIKSTPFYSRCLPNPSDIGSSSHFLNESVAAPQPVTDISLSVQRLVKVADFNELANQLVEDLKASWKTMVIAVCCAVLISFTYIILLRWIAGVVTWFTLIGITILFVGLAAFCYLKFDYIRIHGPQPVTGKMIQGWFEDLLNQQWFWMMLFVVSVIIAFISLLIIIFLRKRIVIAVTLIEEASKAVGSAVMSLFIPVLPWLLQCGVLVWAIAVGVFLSSIGNSVFIVQGMTDAQCDCSDVYKTLKNGDHCIPKKFSELCQCLNPGKGGCYYAGNEAPSYVTWMQLGNIFGFFWGAWFISGIFQMILAGTFATWYWTFNKSRVPFFTITISAFRTFRYHLGTVAFGSLIISICSFIRFCLEYIQNKCKKFNNPVINCFLCCMRCFFWCLENFIKFINRNAYIMCAIHGRNFCMSAHEAFNLLMRNTLRVVVIDKVTDFLFFLGKLVVTGIVVTGTYFLGFRQAKLELNHTWLPLIIIAIFTYIIASIFFSVYTMAVNTLLLCFLEDCERNDGSKERPYYMSKSLMKVLGKRNKPIRNS